jgi:glycosyltransferase involved in cell wall biosynthesis
MDAMPLAKGRKVHLIQGYEVWFGPHYLPRVHAALQLPNVKIAISRDLKETIETALGPLEMEVVPNAVDLEQFSAPPRARNPVPVVGFVYATARIKGADICAQAVALARRRQPQLRVVAFGADRPSAEVPLPADTMFFHRPAQNRLRDHYAACDVWLFGSRLDSFGLPMLEAMACRTPVVAVPIGAAEDLMEGGGGVIVPKESPQAMADAIVRLLELPLPQWKQMSDHAYATAHGYSWKDATVRLMEVLSRRLQVA